MRNLKEGDEADRGDRQSIDESSPNRCEFAIECLKVPDLGAFRIAISQRTAFGLPIADSSG